MSRFVAVALCVGLLMGLVAVTAAPAQEYSLKEYMPQTVGSTWTMKAAGDGETSTVEVARLEEVGDQSVPLLLTKNAEGVARRGTLVLVTDDAYTLFGNVRAPRGGDGELTTMLYAPAPEFPGKLAVGQSAKATTKITFGDREVEMTMELKLEALEDVTVAAGTFKECLKLVTITTTGRGDRTSTAWYAKGVGAVKTERPGFGDRPATTEELVEYKIAE